MSDNLRARIYDAALSVIGPGNEAGDPHPDAERVAGAVMAAITDRVSDDLDQFVREQAEQDPAFASAYVEAEHSARIRAYEDLLASVWLHIDWRVVTRKLTTDQQALFADSVDAHADRIAEADPAFGQPARANRWWVG